MPEAYFKAKKRSGKGEKVKSGALPVDMNQGGRLGPHAVPQTLSEQMGQPGGYDHELTCEPLGSFMGQRGAK